MSGKVLRFKTPCKTPSGLQFLRIDEDESASFSLHRGSLTFRFTLDINGCLDAKTSPFLFDEDRNEAASRESFTEEEDRIFLAAVKEAAPIAREQLEMWRECSAVEKLSLQITWALDVLQWLLQHAHRDLVQDPPNLENLQRRLCEISDVQGRLAGLRAALSYL